MLVKSVNAGERDWIPVFSKNGEGWVAAEFIAQANVVYQIERIIDPSARGSDSVGVTAFKIELPDKTLRFIELAIPPGFKLEEFSSLTDKELVQRAIDLYDANWERYKNRPMT
jgi:hypothetical protein